VVNKYRPHLLVLCEDQATHDIATGFNDKVTGAMEVRKPLRGWPHVLQEFQDVYIPWLRQHPHCHIALFIDFDNVYETRIQQFQGAIPQDITDRVFILGACDEAETVKNASGLSLSKIGMKLADECVENTSQLWVHAQVQHNATERQRLHAKCAVFLL
jgi:hypothetical protein